MKRADRKALQDEIVAIDNVLDRIEALRITAPREETENEKEYNSYHEALLSKYAGQEDLINDLNRLTVKTIVFTTHLCLASYRKAFLSDTTAPLQGIAAGKDSLNNTLLR
jgi:dynactin complex subunit